MRTTLVVAVATGRVVVAQAHAIFPAPDSIHVSPVAAARMVLIPVSVAEVARVHETWAARPATGAVVQAPAHVTRARPGVAAAPRLAI